MPASECLDWRFLRAKEPRCRLAKIFMRHPIVLEQTAEPVITLNRAARRMLFLAHRWEEYVIDVFFGR